VGSTGLRRDFTGVRDQLVCCSNTIVPTKCQRLLREQSIISNMLSRQPWQSVWTDIVPRERYRGKLGGTKTANSNDRFGKVGRLGKTDGNSGCAKRSRISRIDWG
jgi:hypothetical protein